jgi:DNA-binding transcriptional MerR regulator
MTRKDKSMDTYTAPQACKLFNCTDQTIRRWAKELAEYLSPTANPPANETRIFTTDDLPILALAAEMREENPRVTYDSIRASLANGQRGEVTEHTALATSDQTALAVRALSSQVQEFHEQMIRVETQLEMTEKRLEATEAERDELREKYLRAKWELEQLQGKKLDESD